MTTADVFRERGWGVGMKVTDSPGGEKWWEVIAVGNTNVFLRSQEGYESAYTCLFDWYLYRPTPPVPTPEEWRELWAVLEAWRGQFMGPCSTFHENTRAAMRAIDAMKAKVTP